MSAWHKEWDDPAGRVGGSRFGGPGGAVTYWTKQLLLFNGIVFLLLFVLGSGGARLADWLAVDPARWGTHPPYFPIWQILTYGFVHAGLQHILFNSLVLYFFGTMLERALGSRKFLTVYFGALLIGGLLHAVLAPLVGFTAPMVGASGAIMGVLVGAAMLFPHSQVLLFFIPIPLWVGASILFVIDLIGMAQPGGGTAHDVHLAGALFGFLYIKAGWHLRADLALFDLPSTLAAHRARGRESHRLGEEARLDELLARISKAGLNSLSKSEKEFLKRMSKRP